MNKIKVALEKKTHPKRGGAMLIPPSRSTFPTQWDIFPRYLATYRLLLVMNAPQSRWKLATA
ncbi:hypothetical protein XFF6166_40023 [Xanthomonas citri pv. fuscans]|nr:hypothetical protein CKU38_04324 [Xanthomonas citri pv. fuscans]SON79608.1 hypothetical protein XFF6166_40023 [Xanthomonas citri pv. fuscans]SOO05104.1 hypothetical protein XFF7767_360023 [Xanthomonas citri pv. fuscans]SOO11291.1 hypothetical protein XFF6970_710023 [Xanthomonas citri pv. fuscans]SOO14638.1 hypothetical protein XFF7766_330007 [Xanthomonas citri pv. fuscans]